MAGMLMFRGFQNTCHTPSRDVGFLKISPRAEDGLKIQWRMQENWESSNQTQISCRGPKTPPENILKNRYKQFHYILDKAVCITAPAYHNKCTIFILLVAAQVKKCDDVPIQRSSNINIFMFWCGFCHLQKEQRHIHASRVV
jgi:hypothetical protein